jgi:uncharacterized protein VirK/YbjX
MPAQLTSDDADLAHSGTKRRTPWQLAGALVAYVQREWAERGPMGLWRACMRYGGVLRRWPAHRALVRVMSGPSTRAVRDAYPRLEYRYTLPYLSLHFQRRQRYEMLRAHYALVNARFTPEFARQVLAGTLCLWSQSLQGREASIVFKGHCLQTRHREGELTLAMLMDGVSLYELSFSFIQMASIADTDSAAGRSSAYVAYVGRVQGAAGQYERIRLATKCCGEVAPPDLLMSALAGLLAAMGIHTVVGVDNDSSISHETIRSAETNFDYSAFWARYGAVLAEGRHAVMQAPFADKPIAAIASRHRKRTLLKREFKQALSAQAQQVLAAYLTQP